jgi:threonylcarbamoyladenosine tRNA methylthiotransferase MtaB
MTVSFYTLGCKLNQAESDSLAAAFAVRGFPVLSAAGILRVINTCTVTGKAEQKMRRVIRLQRQDTDAVIIVTGCAVKIRETRGKVFYVPGPDKPRLAELPEILAARGLSPENADDPGGHSDALYAAVLDWYNGLVAIKNADAFTWDGAGHAASPRSRPFLKIQDGCDRACAYCAVTIARGPSVSLDKTVVRERLCLLEEAGYGEAVLTGVNICQYPDLAGLISDLLEHTGRIRLRLSSLEPDAVDERLLRALESPRVRPHFHLSLQSGSDAVLARMGRRYGAVDVERVCTELRQVKNDPFLAGDIITGFPGESGADFEATYDLCEKAAFAWIHAFPFSPRPGTAAAGMKGRVPQRETTARSGRIRALARKGIAAYEERWIGRMVEAVVEQCDDDKTVSLITENYLKQTVPREQTGGKKPGSLVTVCYRRMPKGGLDMDIS